MLKNEKIDVAIDELNKHGVKYRFEMTANRHYKLFIEGVRRVIVISGSHTSFDCRILMNIRRDIRKAIAGQLK